MSIFSCKKENCTVSVNGKCLEGHSDPSQCPNIIIVDKGQNNKIIKDADISTNNTNGIFIDLFQGNAMDLVQSDIITRNNFTKLIIIAGPVESGKTTLLLSIYEKFQESSFAGYLFAGSLTLPEFERRCHLGRIESWSVKADTERTRRESGINLLHLKVCNEGTYNIFRDVLLTDLTGEIFESIRDSTEECKKFKTLLRSDHFVLLLDCNKIVDKQYRQNALFDGLNMLQSCLDADMLNKTSYVQILFSKIDIIDRINDIKEKEEVNAFINYIEQKFITQFSQRVKNLCFFKVAARPEDSLLPFGYGLDKLFQFWIEETANRSFINELSMSTTFLREIDRFKCFINH